MSEENNAKSGDQDNSQSEDVIKNLKEEVNRKLGNTEASLAELQKQNQALLDQIGKMNEANTQIKSKAASSEEIKLSDLIYDDPDKAIEIIQQRAEEKITKKLEAQKLSETKTTETLNKLIAEFPELSNTDTDLYKKAIEIYNEMDEADKTSPLAYKSAVYAAATNIGVKPKSKRSEDESQDFTLSSSSSAPSRSSRKSSKLDEGIIESAKLMGLDTEDPKVVERLKARSKRKNWLKYE